MTPTSTESKTITQKNKPSLSQRLFPTFSDDARQARWKMVTSHKVIDPNIFKNPTDRFAAIAARGDRIVSDKRFKALKPEEQQKVLANYYDRYVVPGYTQLGFKAPDKDLYIRELPKEAGKLDSRAFYFGGYKNSEASQREPKAMGEEASKLFKGISYAGIWLGKNLAYQQLGLSHFLHLDKADIKEEKQTIEDATQHAKAIVDKVNNSIFDSDKFWLQTHPSKRWTSKLENGIGEQLVQLPLYSAVGSFRAAAELKIGSKIPALGRAANLTERLASNKLGRFVARRLGEGADAYIGGTLLGETTEEKIKDMAAFMGFGTAIEGIGAGVKYPTKGLIKILTARNAAMGGKVFQDAVTDAADHELANNILGYNHLHEPISIHPDIKNPTNGVIKIGTKEVPYKGAAEQQDAITKIIRANQEHDPVRASVVNAEKMTLSAMARDRYGKPWNRLSQSQRFRIRSLRDSITKEAINEAPLHNPDIVEAQIDMDLDKFKKQNPVFAQTVAQFEKMSGIKVSGALKDAQTEQIESETGVKQTQGTIKKIGKITQSIKRAEVKAKTAITGTVNGVETGARKFAQMKIDNLAYFINRAKKAGSLKNLSAEIKDMESDEFRHSLLEEMGHKDFRFENPEHALLWANTFRKQLPRPFQKRLIEELHEMKPDETIRDWDRKSKNLEVHMHNLAYTERLFNEGNIFRSTNVDNLLSRTVWQDQLFKEVSDRELEELRKVLIRYPKQYTSVSKVVKNLQKFRLKTFEPEEVEETTEKIRDLIKDAAKHNTIQATLNQVQGGNQ